MTYHIITYGCQMNESDSERIASILENVGYKKAPKENRADLIILNACSVRQSAINRVYGKINNLKKLKTKNYKLQTIVTGCILKKDKEKFKNMADLILDIKDLPKLPNMLQKKDKTINIARFAREARRASRYLDIRPKYQNKISAFVPIMTGCDNFCAYCAVPYTRGGEISRTAEEIIREVKNLVKKGRKEIWLLGQNVNSYGIDRGTTQNGSTSLTTGNTRNYAEKISFAKLLKMINDIHGNFWIRFTSPHPKDFSNELIKTLARCEKFAPYINLPVQSGDNKILKKMNRPYTADHYKILVKKIRGEFTSTRKNLEKNIAISTDAIVGFPGETKKQFENTAKLFREIGFDMAYIAKYSPRPGTAAAKLKDNVQQKEKKRREKVLTEILKKSAHKNNKKYLGKTCEVLIEKAQKNFLLGKTRSYKTIKIYRSHSESFGFAQSKLCKESYSMANKRDSSPAAQNDKSLIGKFVKVKITDAMEWGLRGRFIG